MQTPNNPASAGKPTVPKSRAGGTSRSFATPAESVHARFPQMDAQQLEGLFTSNQKKRPKLEDDSNNAEEL